MAVVMQPAFLIEILTLKTQRVVDFSDVDSADFSVGTVMRRPDDFAVLGSEFLRGAEVVELVVVGLGFLWTKTFQQRQRTEAFRFVEIAAVPIRVVFSDEFVALPEELGRNPINGFADTPPKRVVEVAGGLAVGRFNADQTMLTVVAVFGDEGVAFVVIEDEAVVVWQAQVLQLAAGVVAVADLPENLLRLDWGVVVHIIARISV
jgi:hypothetical protein